MISKMADGQSDDGRTENGDGGQQNNAPENGLIHQEVVDVELIVQQASQEYSDLDKTLDQIDSWMTKLEEQSDSIYTEVENLIESSRQVRRELQEENGQTMDSSDGPQS